MSAQGGNDAGKARAKLHGAAALLLLAGAGLFLGTESIAAAILGLALTAAAGGVLFIASRRNQS